MAMIKFGFARGGHFTAKVMLDKAPQDLGGDPQATAAHDQGIQCTMDRPRNPHQARPAEQAAAREPDSQRRPRRRHLRPRMVGPRRHRLRGHRVVLRHRDRARLARRIPRQPVRPRRPERVALPGRGRPANLATGRRRLHHQRRGRIIRPRVSSRRKRGPITTGIRCSAQVVGQRLSIEATRRMGPRFRGDDAEGNRHGNSLRMARNPYFTTSLHCGQVC